MCAHYFSKEIDYFELFFWHYLHYRHDLRQTKMTNNVCSLFSLKSDILTPIMKNNEK
jgi:hypothetical protein